MDIQRDAKEVLGKEEYPYLKIVECPGDVNAENEIQTVILEVKSEQKKAKMRELQVSKRWMWRYKRQIPWDMY